LSDSCRIKPAFISAFTQLATNCALSIVFGAPSRLLGAGYTIACALTCAVSVLLLWRRTRELLERTFQSQPYASEDYAYARQ